MRSLRTIFLVLAAALPSQTRKANVLLLIADDLGVDYVGCYKEGTNPAKTPVIDSLAAKGVLFRNAWAYPLCTPTRAALMTGRYGFRTGIGHLVMGRRGAQRRIQGAGTISPDLLKELTLPKFLDQAKSGYDHALIGKWHLGGGDTGPNDIGWSHFSGLLAGIIGRSYFSWRRTVDGETATSTKYSTTQKTDDALKFIHASEKSGRPWVCVVAFVAPHSPFHQPPEHLHTIDAKEFESGGQVANYRAMVEALDTEIGRLLKGLGEARERTNVIFMGDNGTPGQVVQEPFRSRDAKGSIYEGGINVPLVVAGPAVGGEPRETPALVHVVDMYSTIAELCGVDVAQQYPKGRLLDGVSIVPMLLDPETRSVRKTVFTELFRGDPNRDGRATIRDARYKMVRIFRGDAKPKDRMYDLQKDPFEVKDVLRRRPSPEILSRYDDLRKEFDRLRGSGR